MNPVVRFCCGHFGYFGPKACYSQTRNLARRRQRWTLAGSSNLDSCATASLVSVLRETQVFLHRPENDFDWSGWVDADQATAEVGSHIAAIERGKLTTLTELVVLFAPTGPIQEVSVSSGWGDEFLELANRFDAALSRARSRFPK